MSEQTSFPVPAEPTSGACAWCGKPARRKLEIQSAVRGIDKMTGVQVIKRHAITSWACTDHLRSLERSERVQRQAAQAHAKAGGSAKGKGIVIR